MQRNKKESDSHERRNEQNTGRKKNIQFAGLSIPGGGGRVISLFLHISDSIKFLTSSNSADTSADILISVRTAEP